MRKFNLYVVWAGWALIQLMSSGETWAQLPSHDAWNTQLQRYVNDAGWVDYTAWQQDTASLNAYLDHLEAHPPRSKWTRDQRKAYWINAYNAYTVQIVLRNYPVNSIKDIGPKRQIPFVNTVWDIKFIEIDGNRMDLNQIEHKQLRKKFHDPRVHFAIVCASYSCPRLLNEAYVPERLDEQLDMMARDFIADTRKNVVEGEHLQLSKIFSWYRQDFKSRKTPDILSYIAQYTDVQFSEKAKIEWQEYKWTLNDQSQQP